LYSLVRLKAPTL